MLQLKDIFKKYGTSTTTNFDLMKIAEDLNIQPFYYVMRDEVKNLKQQNGRLFGCTNIHTSDEKGVHHSCFVRDDNTNSFFFDSYGLPPTKEVFDLMKHGEYNTFQIQTPGTKYCGQLSMYVLYKLKEGVPFLDTLLELRELAKPTKTPSKVP